MNISENYDEINLYVLSKLYTKYKKTVVVLFIIPFLVSIFVAFISQNQYKSSILLAPVDVNESNQFSSYSSLASLAGVSLKEEVDKSSIALEVLKSRKFFEVFANKRNILPELMASQSWNSSTNKLIYDTSKYDPRLKKWIDEEPSINDAYDYWIKSVFTVIEDKKNGFTRVSINFLSPYIAKSWTELLLIDLNQNMLDYDIKEADLSIDFLNNEVLKTNSEELKSLFYEIIQTKTEQKMLAYARQYYVFKIIDPAYVPSKPHSPNRTMIVLIGIFIGSFLGLLFVLVRYYLFGEKVES